jgi:hypothetical protein
LAASFAETLRRSRRSSPSRQKPRSHRTIEPFFEKGVFTAVLAFKRVGIHGFHAELGRRLGEPIPLAWEPNFPSGVQAIEVYPSATLLAHGVATRGYRVAGAGNAARPPVLAALAAHFQITPHEPALLDNAHLLDAAVCVLAGLDFIRGEAMRPEDKALAEQEGWVWCRKNKVI